jgi:hypothetical protein
MRASSVRMRRASTVSPADAARARTRMRVAAIIVTLTAGVVFLVAALSPPTS